VRDEQRQRLPDRAVQVVVGVDGDQPLDVERVGDVDVEHPGVGVRAADEGHRERVLAEVVQVAALSGEQPGVLAALDRGAEELRGHAGSPCSAARSARISAARSTEATMFW
jgi:hypothetical protein